MNEIVRHHKHTFEHTRYHMETREGEAQRDLTGNLDLWKFALAAFR